MKKAILLQVCMVMLAITGTKGQGMPGKPASAATIKAYNEVRNGAGLNFNNPVDSMNAYKGLLKQWPDLAFDRYDAATASWDMSTFSFLNSRGSGNAPYTVNPSLWREAKLNYIPGIFQVADGIYQARGFDLANSTFIKGKSGWIMIDPLGTPESAKASFDSLVSVLKRMKVSAPDKLSGIILTHSHIDHYGGILGVLPLLKDKKAVYAPFGFLDHAISENTIAGNAMGRRATYMYGSLLQHDDTHSVDAGLGKGISKGNSGIVSDYVQISGGIMRPMKVQIDGVDVEFWSTPGAEAPVEVMFYFPKLKALCASEEVTHTMHNVYSLRGAKVRDALAWSKFIDSTLTVYGNKAAVIFASHHWPVWGSNDISSLLVTQRDLYRYIHDQSMRLANQGSTPTEIAAQIKLPRSLDTQWANRGYYGTLSHNSKSVYNYYLGWFDGNPVNLDPLPPREAGLKYVQFMGGYKNVMQQAKASFDSGDYRWTAMVVNHVVFAYPEDAAARTLLADTYEQLGYQAESAPWRNFYLTGALELRIDISKYYGAQNTYPTNEVMNAMPIDQYLDFMAIHMVPDLNKNRTLNFKVKLNDKGSEQTMTISLQNSAVHYTIGSATPAGISYDAEIELPRDTMNVIITRGADVGTNAMKAAVSNKKATIKGDTGSWYSFIGMLEEFKFWFNIVRP